MYLIKIKKKFIRWLEAGEPRKKDGSVDIDI